MRLHIPLIKQSPNYCVPASLAMVFQYLGYHYNQAEIAKWFRYEVEKSGVMKCCDIVQSVRERGFVAQARENIGLEGIIQTVNKQIPLIAVIKHAETRCASHAVVVVGYETQPNYVWINDPQKTTYKISYSKFAKLWRIRRKKDGSNQYGIILEG